MAEQAILTVSLKDYKKQIDDLRASLLNLESTSEEYKTIAEEIKDRQDKLNEVMGVGKKDIDAVAGSYNALTQELSALKKEWKTLEIGSERWVELGNQIDGINNKLKEADASVGVFGRNVGNYQNAFEGAMKSMLSQLGSINPVLGKMGSTVSQLIPVIKSVSKAATSGLKGIKAAIASTGIGALIVALGVLATYVTKNWDSIKAWALGTKKASEAVAEHRKEVEKAKTAHEQYIKYLQGKGATAMQIQIENVNFYNKQLEKEKQLLTDLQSLGRKGKELVAEQMKAVGEASKASDEQVQALNNSLNAFVAEQEKLERQKGMTTLEKQLDDVKLAFDDAVDGAKKLAEVTGDSSWLQAAIENLERLRQAAYDRAKQDEAKKKWEEEEKTISSLTKTLTDSFKTREELLKSQYDKEYKLLKKHHKDTTLLTEAYNRDMKKLQMETMDAINSSYANLSSVNSAFTSETLLQSLDHAEAKLQMFSDIVGEKGMPPGPPLAKTIEKITSDMSKMAWEMGLIERADNTEFAIAWQVAAARVKSARAEIEKYSYTYERLAASINNSNEKLKASYVTSEPVAKIRMQIAELNITLSGITDIYTRMEELPYLIEEASGEEKEALEKELEDIEKGIVRIGVLKYELNQQLKELKDELANTIVASNQRVYDIAAEDANTNKDTTGWWNTTNFDEGFQKRLEAEQYALSVIDQMHFENDAAREDYEREHQQRLLEIQQEYTQQRIQNYQDLAGGIGSILNSIGDLYEQDIQNQVNAGNKSKAQAEKEYKKVQAIKVATATIDTIQGAIAAFMGYQEIGQPWGAILGAIQAAAVTAAGIAQIAKIKSTNPYSNSTPDSSSYAAATPTLNDYTPEYFTNVTGANDTKELVNAIAETPIKAYVVESDINAAQQLREERDRETTY